MNVKLKTRIVSASCFALIATALFLTFGYLKSEAITSYPPAALLQTGDITSNLILNNTIQDIDVASGTRISLFKIGQGANGAVMFFRNGHGQATTSNLVIDYTNARVGVATATPMSGFSVHGNSYLTGNLESVANIVATGTVGIGTTSPAATLGVQGNVFVSGNLSNIANVTATGTISIGTTSPSAALAVHGNTLISGDLTNVANLTATGTITTSGSATSTWTSAGLSVAGGGLASSQGLTLSGGALVNTASATSTFTGGISAASVALTNGLTITGGGLLNTSTATSTFSGGLGVTSLSASAGLTVTGGALLATGLPAYVGTLGVGTTSPAATLGVQGSALVSGTTTTGALIATSTLGVGTTSPAATLGVQGNVMLSGNLTIGGTCTGCLGSWQEIASTTMVSGANSLTASWTGPHQDIECMLHLTTPAANSQARLQFSSDAGPNYGSNKNTNNGAYTTENGITFFTLQPGNTTLAQFYKMVIVNRSTSNKYARWFGYFENSTASSVGTLVDGFGQFANSTTSISSLTLFLDSGTALGSGTRISCYGSPY